MKVSINLAQEFSNVDLKSIPHDEILARIGAQLGAVEDAVDWAPKTEGAVIARVVSCEKHPNADKLSICRIDDGGRNQAVERGEDGLIQVVCGAPNVGADMFVVWLAPGVTVPSSRETDPFVLEAREIRGVVSNGMLASAHELGISEDHSGILNITAEEAGKQPVPGEPLIKYFGLDDFVIDCENKMFTHRPDCFGNLGIARELAGIFDLRFKSPDWYLNNPVFEERHDLSLQSSNDVLQLVPRFMTVTMNNISIKPSPIWLQALLTRVGIKPINNVVDTTNYVMHLTGQPLHAFDYDKIAQRSDNPGVFPRMSQKGEKLTLLGQKEVELRGEEIVISTDRQAVALAGVMGGAETEVDTNTKNIIIECATFDMYSIRRTSMRHGLFTDAVTRYNKGQSPQQNDRVLDFAMQKMSEFAGARQASNVIDLKQNNTDKTPIKLTTNFVNERLGSSIDMNGMTGLLRNVEFNVNVEDSLVINPPFWRMDIEQPEDIVEEIGRLYGYDKLPVELPKRTAKPAPKKELVNYKQSLRNQLKEAGANEVLTYSFVHGELLKKSGIDAETTAYHLRNALSPDLQYYRPSLMPSLMAKIHPNIKNQAGSENNQFVLYEIGQAHQKGKTDSENLPEQMDRIALVVTADDKTAKAKQAGSAYYLARKYLDWITGGLAEYAPLKDFEAPITKPFAKGRSAILLLNGEEIGVIGEFSSSVLKSFKLPGFSAGFELDLKLLLNQTSPKVYLPLPSFPPTKQDLTLEIPLNKTFSEAKHQLAQKIIDNSKEHGYKFELETLNIFEPENSDIKKLTFRIILWHSDRTLTTEETTRLTDAIKT